MQDAISLRRFGSARRAIDSAITSARAEHVAGQTLAMHTHQSRTSWRDLAFDQAQDDVRHQGSSDKAANRSRRTRSAVSRSVRPRSVSAAGDWRSGRIADAQPMWRAEFHQLRKPRHRSVIVQNFAEHPGGLKPSHRARSTAASVWPARRKTAALPRPQREDMAGLHQVSGADLGSATTRWSPRDRAR